MAVEGHTHDVPSLCVSWDGHYSPARVVQGAMGCEGATAFPSGVGGGKVARKRPAKSTLDQVALPVRGELTPYDETLAMKVEDSDVIAVRRGKYTRFSHTVVHEQRLRRWLATCLHHSIERITMVGGPLYCDAPPDHYQGDLLYFAGDTDVSLRLLPPLSTRLRRPKRRTASNEEEVLPEDDESFQLRLMNQTLAMNQGEPVFLDGVDMNAQEEENLGGRPATSAGDALAEAFEISFRMQEEVQESGVGNLQGGSSDASDADLASLSPTISFHSDEGMEVDDVEMPVVEEAPIAVGSVYLKCLLDGASRHLAAQPYPMALSMLVEQAGLFVTEVLGIAELGARLSHPWLGVA